jgi:hypothetical protein
MKVFEVTGRSVRREKFHVVWRCGAPWPVADKKNGLASVTHQLRLFRKASDPKFDELVEKEPVIDDETGEPKMLKDKDGKPTDKPMMRVRINNGTGAPVRRALKWCQRADGSRVVECYEDTFELAKTDDLVDILSVEEVKGPVVSIADAENGESYEALVAREGRKPEVVPFAESFEKPRRGAVKGTSVGPR